MGQQSDTDVSIDDSFSAGASVTIDEDKRLDFAKKILAVMGLVCIATFVAYALFPDNTALNAIFEFIKIGALPLITLVISFYFPSSNN
ncbi:MAG TPA: hypothetical protein DCY38_01130 [Opitutae bacterium]|jgi:hypothetical protein|nr:hypothetical protein [Opitutae bacterium]